MEARDIPLCKLRIRQDARPVDQKSLAALVESVSEIGFTCSILVRPKIIYEGGQEADGFEIIAGRHRFEVAQQLGMETLPCRVAEYDDLRAELAMLDENLKRAALSPAADAQALLRRKEIYEALYPETKRGNAGAEARWNATDNLSVASFAKATAQATGRDERTVQRAVSRGSISERALGLVQGTHLDTGTFLDKIKSLDPKDQEARVQAELAAPRKPISPAPAVRNEYESYQSFLNKVVKLFDGVPQEWRELACEHVLADTPVMDRGAA